MLYRPRRAAKPLGNHIKMLEKNYETEQPFQCYEQLVGIAFLARICGRITVFYYFCENMSRVALTGNDYFGRRKV